MKIAISLLAIVLAGLIGMHLLHGPIHSDESVQQSEDQNALVRYFHGSESEGGVAVASFEDQSNNSEAVTFSIRQNDYDLCTDQFYVEIYELTVNEFARGADQVVLSEYQANVFDFVRTTENFHYGDREGWVDHIKDIPAQLIDIIREDPAVLDSCANFSVALVGPP